MSTLPFRTLSVSEIDPDWRRDPKTKIFCFRCQKDLKTGQKRREIRVIMDWSLIVHPEDIEKYTSDSQDCGWYPVGMDCARKIGLEWSRPVNEK